MATRTGPPVVKVDLHGQNARAGLLQDVNTAFLGRHDAELRQKKPRADHRMAGKGQFGFRGENAKAGERAIAGGLLHEYGLGKIHLSRNGLHQPRGQAVAIGDDREGIAGERLVCENVELVKMPLHSLLTRPAPGR